MDAITKFGNALAGPASKIAISVLNDDRKSTEQWMRSVLKGVPDPSVPAASPLRRDDHFVVRLLQAFSEIEASLATLTVIGKLARRSPAKLLGVEPSDQLRFLTEAFLNEVYILSSRCEAMLTLLERAYKADARHDHVRRVCATLRTALAASFKPIVSVRGAHVHESRYEDFEVSRLGTLRILGSKEPLFRVIREDALRHARRSKVQWMTKNTINTTGMLDNFFMRLHKLVFDTDGAVLYPSPCRRAKD